MILTENRSPLFGIMLPSYFPLFLVDDADEMLNLGDHAANCRGVLQLGDPADLVELEADQRRTLRVMAADRAAGLLDLDHLCGLGHRHNSEKREKARLVYSDRKSTRLNSSHLGIS